MCNRVCHSSQHRPCPLDDIRVQAARKKAAPVATACYGAGIHARTRAESLLEKADRAKRDSKKLCRTR